MKPLITFGEDTPELEAFYEAVTQIAPGATLLRNTLINAWQPFADKHSWVLPDGFHAHVKVMVSEDKKIEIDELSHATFTHRFYENAGTESGLSLAANVIHSLDGMVVREMNRRCNYDPEQLQDALALINAYLIPPAAGYTPCRREFVSLVEIDNITEDNIASCPQDILLRVKALILQVLEKPSFELVCIHDDSI